MNLREELFYNTWPEVSGLTGDYKTEPKRKRITEAVTSTNVNWEDPLPQSATVVALYLYSDGDVLATEFGIPAGKSLNDLEEYLYDEELMFVDIHEETLKSSAQKFTSFEWLNELDPDAYEYRGNPADADVPSSHNTLPAALSAKIAANADKFASVNFKYRDYWVFPGGDPWRLYLESTKNPDIIADIYFSEEQNITGINIKELAGSPSLAREELVGTDLDAAIDTFINLVKKEKLTESSNKDQRGQLGPYLETIKSLGIYNDALNDLDDPERLINALLTRDDIYKRLLLNVHRELRDRDLYDDFLHLSGAERDFLDADEDTEDIYADIFDVIGSEAAKFGGKFKKGRITEAASFTAIDYEDPLPQPATVIVGYNDDDGYDQVAEYGVPAGKSLQDLEDNLYDQGMMAVFIEEETLKPSAKKFTDFEAVAFKEPADYDYESGLEDGYSDLHNLV